MDSEADRLPFEALFDHADFVHGLARALVGEAGGAEDLAQETWLAAIRRPPPAGREPRPWLVRTMRNLAARLWRTRASVARRESSAPPPPPVPAAGEILAREEVRRELVRAVLDLAEPSRSALVLRYLEGLPPREIARRLGVPVETVRTRITRGVAVLRERLDDGHDGDRRAWLLPLLPLVGPLSRPPFALTLGGLAAMTVAKKLAVAAVLLALLAGAGLWIASRGDLGESPAPPTGVPDVADSGEEPAVPEEVAEETAGETPAPADAPEPTVPVVVVRGRVLDAKDRRPVPGAAIRLVPGGSVEGWSEFRAEGPIGETATGADGTFVFPDVPAEGLVTAEVRAPGYSPAEVSLDLRDPAKIPEPVTLALERAGTVRGIVTGPDGAPVGGAIVFAIPGDAPAMLLRNPDQVVSGTGGRWQSLAGRTADDGRYEIGGLAPGAVYILRATADGFADSRDHPGVRTTGADPDAAVDLALRRAASLIVRVLDPDGKPLAAVDAFLTYEDSPVFLGSLRNPEEPGVFRIVDLPPGAHPLEVRPSGYLTETFEIELEEGERRELTVRASAGAELAGVLLDGEGKPVAGARVFTSRPRDVIGKVPHSSGQCMTDEDGAFRITGLYPGPYVLSFYRPPYEPVMTGPFTAPIRGIRLLAAEYATVRARVRFPAGNTPPAKIEVLHSGRAYDPELWFDGSRSLSARQVPVTDGAIVIDRLSGGPVRLFLSAGELTPVRLNLELTSGEDRDLGEIVFSTGIVLAGRVEDPSGHPVAGADVSAGFAALRPARSSVTGKDGGFELAGLDEARWWIEVGADGFVPATVEVVPAPGRAVLTVTLHRGGLLRGRVVDAQGNPATGLDLHVFDPAAEDSGGREEYLSTDARGAFETRLLAGEYRIEVWRRHDKLREAEATLTEGGTTECEIRLDQ